VAVNAAGQAEERMGVGIRKETDYYTTLKMIAMNRQLTKDNRMNVQLFIPCCFQTSFIKRHSTKKY